MSATLADVESYAISYFEILNEKRAGKKFYAWSPTAMAGLGDTPAILDDDDRIYKFHTSEAAVRSAFHWMKTWQRGVLWRQAEATAAEYVLHKARRGRPPGPALDSKTDRVEVRMTPEQKAKLESLGGAQWVRDLIDNGKAPG